MMRWSRSAARFFRARLYGQPRRCGNTTDVSTTELWISCNRQPGRRRRKTSFPVRNSLYDVPKQCVMTDPMFSHIMWHNSHYSFTPIIKYSKKDINGVLLTQTHTTISWPLCRSTYVIQHTQLRTWRFSCSKLSLPKCLCHFRIRERMVASPQWCYLHHFRINNRTGPPCSVGHPSAHAPGSLAVDNPCARRPDRLPAGSVTDNNRRRRQTPVSKTILAH